MPTFKRWYRKSVTGVDTWVVRSASTPDPPPSVVTIYGSSAGANSAVTETELDPKIVRVFSQGAWSSFPGKRLIHSEKPTIADFSDTSSPNYVSARNSLRTIAAAMPDIEGQRFAIWHEPIDNEASPQVPAAAWVSMQVNCKNDVLNFVNASRTNPILLTGILNGQSCKTGIADSYYNSTSLAALDEPGADFYNISDLTTGIAWLQSKGVTAWSISELGDQVGDPGHTDVEVLQFMQDAVAAINAAWIPPTFVSWFNSLENTLVTRTTAAIGIGDTTMPVTGGFAPAGIVAKLGTGASAENVTLGSIVGGTTYTINISAATKTHATQSVVYLRPQSFNYWLPLIQASP